MKFVSGKVFPVGSVMVGHEHAQYVMRDHHQNKAQQVVPPVFQESRQQLAVGFVTPVALGTQARLGCQNVKSVVLDDLHYWDLVSALLAQLENTLKVLGVAAARIVFFVTLENLRTLVLIYALNAHWEELQRSWVQFV